MCVCVSVKEGVIVSRTRCFHKVEVEVLEVHSCSGSFSGRDQEQQTERGRKTLECRPTSSHSTHSHTTHKLVLTNWYHKTRCEKKDSKCMLQAKREE